jgi:hypothetical protein
MKMVSITHTNIYYVDFGDIQKSKNDERLLYAITPENGSTKANSPFFNCTNSS